MQNIKHLEMVKFVFHYNDIGFLLKKDFFFVLVSFALISICISVSLLGDRNAL